MTAHDMRAQSARADIKWARGFPRLAASASARPAEPTAEVIHTTDVDADDNVAPSSGTTGRLETAPASGTRDFGPLPRFALLPVTDFISDPAYQRVITSRKSEALIAAIQAEFRWSKFQPPIVAERDDGTLAIIDGQHRVEAARRLGIEQVPCQIIQSESLAAEAGAFVSVNADRVSVTPLQLHHSKVAAGDAESVKIKSVCDEAGITIARTSMASHDLPPGHTLALGAIGKCLRAYPEKTVVDALFLLVEAFPIKGGQLRSGIIRGLCLFFDKAGDLDVDWKRLTAILAAKDMEDFERKASTYKEAFNTTMDRAIAATLIKAYNSGRKEDQRIPETLV